MLKPAHTIVDVPPHVEHVPAYLRKALKQAGPKVRIGCAYEPALRITPAVHTPKRKLRVRAWIAATIAALIATCVLGAP